MKTLTLVFTIITICCFGLWQNARAVNPLPDGCYPNFTTAEGCKALQSLTTGVANTGIGWYSLFGTRTGSYNTAVGAGALDLNTADANTAVGVAALLLNTTGTNNTATGAGALVSNDSGEGNTATGAFALYSNTDGQFNTANGEFTLYFNTSGERNTAVGDSALYLNTEGSRNTAVGNPALLNNTTGDDNTAIGASSLFSNTTGTANVAVGTGALLANGTVDNNTAVGFQALTHNTGSVAGFSENSAMGSKALFSNTTGYGNTATGAFALQSNTTGARNTANGINALFANTNGDENIAIGSYALSANTAGSSNVAIGFQAADSNSSGFGNTAIGYHALRSNTGDQSIAIGESAGSSLTTGNGNIDIGNIGAAGDSGTIRIGDFHQRTFIAGISGAPVIGGTTVFIKSDGQLGTVVSSARFKDEIRPIDEASEVLFALRPVAFRYKKEIDSERIPQFGLVAEEVDKVDPALVLHDTKGQPYTVRYEQVNAMLLNEFLKEHKTVQQHEATITQLQTDAAKQKATIVELKKMIESLVTRVSEHDARIQNATMKVELSRSSLRNVASD